MKSIRFTTRKHKIQTDLPKLRRYKFISQKDVAEALDISIHKYRMQYEIAPKGIPAKKNREIICSLLGFNEEKIWPTLKIKKEN